MITFTDSVGHGLSRLTQRGDIISMMSGALVETTWTAGGLELFGGFFTHMPGLVPQRLSSDRTANCGFFRKLGFLHSMVTFQSFKSLAINWKVEWKPYFHCFGVTAMETLFYFVLLWKQPSSVQSQSVCISRDGWSRFLIF